MESGLEPWHPAHRESQDPRVSKARQKHRDGHWQSGFIWLPWGSGRILRRGASFALGEGKGGSGAPCWVLAQSPAAQSSRIPVCHNAGPHGPGRYIVAVPCPMSRRVDTEMGVQQPQQEEVSSSRRRRCHSRQGCRGGRGRRAGSTPRTGRRAPRTRLACSIRAHTRRPGTTAGSTPRTGTMGSGTGQACSSRARSRQPGRGWTRSRPAGSTGNSWCGTWRTRERRWLWLAGGAGEVWASTPSCIYTRFPAGPPHARLCCLPALTSYFPTLLVPLFLEPQLLP